MKKVKKKFSSAGRIEKINKFKNPSTKLDKIKLKAMF